MISMPKNMKNIVILITGHYPPPFTANAVRAYYLVRELRNRGLDVVVIPLLSYWQGVKIGEFNEIVISLFKNINAKNLRPNIIRRILDLAIKRSSIYLRMLSGILSSRINNIKAVIATLPPIEALKIAYSIVVKVNSAFIVDLQDLIDEYRVLERPYLKHLRAVFHEYIYSIMPYSDLVLVTTEFMAKALSSKLNVNKKILVVPNGVDIGAYARCFEIRKNVKFNDPVAVFLGDLNWKYHQLESFIKALNILNKRGYNIIFKVIGKGIYLPRLLSLVRDLNINDKVQFLGYISSREEVMRELGTSTFGIVGRPSLNNLWVLTSIRLTLYEYLACGLPILAYGPPNSYTQYFIKRYKVGIYIPSNDPYVIATYLMRGINSLMNYDVLNSRCVGEIYDWSKCFKPLLEFIERYIK